MTAPDPTICPFAPADLPVLQQLRRLAFEPVFASFRDIVGPEIAAHAFAHADAEQAKLLDELSEPASGYQLVVIVVAGEIAGFAAFKLNKDTAIGEISLSAVHPRHAGRGLGTMLFLHALDCMKSAGMKVATVGTGGDRSHAPARRSYEKAGFGPSIPSLYYYKLL